MKILLVTYSLRGGAGKACYRLYEALKEQNPDVKILYLDGFTEINPDIQPYFETRSRYLINQLSGQFRIKVTSIFYKKDRLIFQKSFLHNWLKYHKLFEWADVINLHWIGNTLNWKSFFNRTRKPIVWTLHDMLPFSGGYHYLSELMTLPADFGTKVEKRKAKYCKNALIRIASPSEWLLGVSRNHLPFMGADHVHIFNCASSDVLKPLVKEFARQILGLPQDKKIILFSADNNQSKRKGLNYLVDAVNNIQEQNLFLLSMGKSTSQANINIPRKDLGMLHDEYTLSLAYSSADIVVVPSIEDNSPNIIIESFACGRPVVGFKVGGIPELINDSKLGLLIESVGSEELGEGIKMAIDTKYDSDYIRYNFMARFSYKIAQGKYTDLYEQLINQ